MTTASMNAPVLVVNSCWTAVNILPAWDAINQVILEKADIVDNYQLYDLEKWVNNWDDISKLESLHRDQIINSASFKIKNPEIIRLRDYGKVYHRTPKCSRMGIFARDNYTCQYCGKKFKTKDLNIDHVMPKSRGGRGNWTNLVLSCITCNHTKGNRTPEEAGMILLSKPRAPHWTSLKGNLFNRKNIPKSWEDILGDIYWNISLQDD